MYENMCLPDLVSQVIEKLDLRVVRNSLWIMSDILAFKFSQTLRRGAEPKDW